MTTRKHKTELEKLQAEIDRCNSHCGCDSYCSIEHQKVCTKLRRHAERIAYCTEHDLPIEVW